MNETLQRLKTELDNALAGILTYWHEHGIDETNGGFIGTINHVNERDGSADKGSVLNSRILWTFSAAYRHTRNPVYLQLAERAYYFITDHFLDKQYGGVYWTV